MPLCYFIGSLAKRVSICFIAFPVRTDFYRFSSTLIVIYFSTQGPLVKLQNCITGNVEHFCSLNLHAIVFNLSCSCLRLHIVPFDSLLDSQAHYFPE